MRDLPSLSLGILHHDPTLCRQGTKVFPLPCGRGRRQSELLAWRVTPTPTPRKWSHHTGAQVVPSGWRATTEAPLNGHVTTGIKRRGSTDREQRFVAHGRGFFDWRRRLIRGSRDRWARPAGRCPAISNQTVRTLSTTCSGSCAASPGSVSRHVGGFRKFQRVRFRSVHIRCT